MLKWAETFQLDPNSERTAMYHYARDFLKKVDWENFSIVLDGIILDNWPFPEANEQFIKPVTRSSQLSLRQGCKTNFYKP